ncbi:I78 family peptidase inhibitor [Pseudoxanthomonas sp. CF125]|uniref:I78 family peptidase inhibitor n=1 Tax=Pseudoxanthomonas sp. CF125 TaxID=1855303 RepID=UPI0008837853|nr:I78 family peptidase inhibitor [Pseudoxanthomonas sp. CF125]SDR15201.1 Peptidase inhibitor I78 family protein [Pseudoxanthomonas sp. CF125]
MSRLLLPAAALLTLCLAACTSKPDEQEQAVAQSEERAEEAAQPAPPTPPAAATACDDSQAQWAVGKKVTEAEVEQARKDSGAETARTLKPNQMVTMEFNGNRLNLDLDDAGTVTAIRCG